MNTPYGLPILDDCLTCERRTAGGFCDMPDESLRLWNQVRRTSFYPRGASIFVQGQPQRDICVICVGRVKLYSTTVQGEEIVSRICDAGEVLGLGAAMEGAEHEASAETLEPSVISFIATSDFRRLIRNDSEIILRVARHLSFEVRHAWDHIQMLGSHGTAPQKLARFLLPLISSNGRVVLGLTQQEVADLLGLTRETVSRAFADLKRRKILASRGHIIKVTNVAALSEMTKVGDSSINGKTAGKP